jgi:hypothetical protein
MLAAATQSNKSMRFVFIGYFTFLLIGHREAAGVVDGTDCKGCTFCYFCGLSQRVINALSVVTVLNRTATDDLNYGSEHEEISPSAFCETKFVRVKILASVGTYMVTLPQLRRSRLTATILGIITPALFLAQLALAVEVTEPQGIAHAYPALFDINGKKLADGEFKQWIEGDRLRIKISYEFSDGHHFEENVVLRQKPQLVEEEWSWKERKNGKLLSEFTVNFLSKTATAQIHQNNEQKHWSEKIKVEPGRSFAGFGFTLAIVNLRKRLINGEEIQLKAVGFAPNPQVVTVQISNGSMDKMKMSGRSLKGDRFIIHPEIPWIASLFINVPDTRIWLTHSAPPGFLRWEGPIVLPSDPLIRVDLVSAAKSGPAQPADW